MAATGPRSRRVTAVKQKLQVGSSLGHCRHSRHRPCAAPCIAALLPCLAACPHSLSWLHSPPLQRLAPQDVEEVMVAVGLGAQLKRRIRNFYTDRWQPDKGAARRPASRVPRLQGPGAQAHAACSARGPPALQGWCALCCQFLPALANTETRTVCPLNLHLPPPSCRLQRAGAVWRAAPPPAGGCVQAAPGSGAG